MAKKQKSYTPEFKQQAVDLYNAGGTSYPVVEHTKTEAGNWEIYLTKKARKIIQTIYNFNKALSLPTGGYIFVNEKGNTHRSSMDYRLQKCCVAGWQESRNAPPTSQGNPM